MNNIFNDTKELENLNLQCYEFFDKLENSIQYGQEFSSNIDESIYDNKVYKELYMIIKYIKNYWIKEY